MPNPLIAMPPFVSPSSPKISPSSLVTLTASNGDGSYTFSVWDNQTGGTLQITGANTATWTSGPQTGMDTIQVVDGQGTVTTRDIVVMNGPTLGTLRADCKFRTDKTNSGFVSDPEWNKWINDGYYELYDRLVTAYDNDYNVADPYLFLSDGVTERYPLAPDFYKLLGLDVQIAGTTSGWMPVPRINFVERNKYATPYQIFYGIRTNLHYRLTDKYVWLIPIPAAGQWMRAHYVPRMSQLVLDSDILDGISGWEEYVRVHACINARVKAEEDASEFKEAKSQMGARIDAIAESRDIANPGTISDTRNQEDWGGGGSNTGFGGL
jgi:hypothetical protein